MEIVSSRKEKFSKPNTKNSSLTKKVATIAIAGSIFVGASAALGSSPLLANVASYFTKILNGESGEMSQATSAKETSTLAELDTFMTALKNRIASELGTWNDSEKTRAEGEIQTYSDDLQTEANTQATTDIADGKEQLTQEANTQIESAKDALDAKYEQIFPTTTTTP
ncbi:hypothetical protein [Fredinandcohnia sp. 179-A 10B2 NHS]|uniref:hypothetical protein n=1 Tax=Fredinandcohnia sp. 179-A 10B2 NHS TaxID=3235176 RepID=UPI0039A09A7B